MSENESRPVVVGVDGSPASLAALRWAVEDAARRGCAVEAVTAWHADYGVMIGPLPAEVFAEVSPQALKDAARKVQERALEGIEGVEIRRVVAEGDARDVLVKAAADAEVLVVGTRGHGRFLGAVLGSVSSYCVHHAACPVVVVREPKIEQEIEREGDEAGAPITPGPLL